MTPLLELRDVRTGFGSNTVLHGCSYHVREGEIAAVLGLNGAGKSVSLKVVAGLLPAWSGTVTFAGEDITTVEAEARVERGMAHVPQGRQVFPELTVEQNLRLGAYTLRRRNRARYAEVLASVYDRFPILAERRQQAAGTMSGGQQAMLAVARALMAEPRLILVDEASAGLAPVAVEELFSTLREVNRSGVTILMVEQNVTFTLKVADRAHILQQGRILYEGDVASLDHDQVAGYLGIGRLLRTHVASAAHSRNGAAGETASAAGEPEPAAGAAKSRSRTAGTRTATKAATTKAGTRTATRAATTKAGTKTATKAATAKTKSAAEAATRKTTKASTSEASKPTAGKNAPSRNGTASRPRGGKP